MNYRIFLSSNTTIKDFDEKFAFPEHKIKKINKLIQVEDDPGEKAETELEKKSLKKQLRKFEKYTGY